MHYFVGVHITDDSLPMARKDWHLEVEVEAGGDTSARFEAEAAARRWAGKNIGLRADVVGSTWLETRPFESTVKVLSGPPLKPAPW